MGLRQDFEAALQSLKTELITDLNRTDVLDKEKMEALQLEYNQKLVNVQVQFLKMLSSAYSKVSVEFTKPEAGSISDAGTIAITGLGAGAAAAGLSFVTLWTVTGTTWFFWTTTSTVTAAAALAAVLGTSTVVASGILTGGIGLIAGLAMYWAYYPTWRRSLRKQLLEDFDTKILPQLRDWADDVIRKAQAQ